MVKTMINDTELENRIRQQFSVNTQLPEGIVDRIVSNATVSHTRTRNDSQHNSRALTLCFCLLIATISGASSGYFNRADITPQSREDAVFQEIGKLILTSSLMEP